jgi:hypothetical protein
LWLGLFAGGLGLVVWIGSVQHAGSAAPLVSLAIALAGCFGLAAAATQYAGEVEDGTAGWLRTLPLEGRTVWSAKTVVNVGGTLALLLVLGGMVWLAHPPMGRSPDDPSFEYFNAERMVRFSLGAPLLAAAVSVRLRGVLAAVLTTTLLSGVFAWLGSLVSHWNEAPAWGVLAAQIALTGWLSRRWTIAWCGSVDFAAPRPEALVAARTGSATYAQRAWWDVWCDGSPTRRMWRSLVWHELRRLRTFALWWLVLAVAALILTLTGSANMRSGMLLGYGTAALAGVWSLRGEQRREFHAFLGDRGIPSASVWWSKHVVWGMGAFTLTLPCFLCDAWVEGIRHSASTSTLEYSLSGAPLNTHPLATRLTQAALRELPAAASLYAVGHLASLCSVRLIFVLVTTFVGAVAWFAWSSSQAGFNGVSTWLTGSLVAGGTLVAAGLLADRWLARRSLAWGRGIVLVGALGGCALLSQGFAYARYWSLPSDPLPADLRKEMEQLEERMKSPDLDASTAYRQLFDELNALSFGVESRGQEMAPGGERKPAVPQEEQEADRIKQVEAVAGWLDRLAEAGEKHASGSRRPLLDPHMFRTRSSFAGETMLLLSDGSRFTKPLALMRESGDVEREWRALLGLLRWARLAKSQEPWQAVFQILERMDASVLERIVDWASLKQVYPNRLTAAIQQLRAEEQGLPPVYERWLARHVVARWYLADNISQLSRIVPSHELHGMILAEAYGAAPRGLWRKRLERAHEASCIGPWYELSVIERLSRSPGDSLKRTERSFHLSELDVYNAKFSAPAFLGTEPGIVRDELMQAPSPLQGFLWESNRPQETIQALRRHNQYRLLLTALTAIHHQKVHDELPSSLHGLRIPATAERLPPNIRSVGDFVPVDVFTGNPFEYAPAGLGTIASAPTVRGLLGGDQPLMWSTGPDLNQWTATRLEKPFQLPSGESVDRVLRLRSVHSSHNPDDDKALPHGLLAKPTVPLKVLFD